MEISQITDFQPNPYLPTVPKILSTQLFVCIYLYDDKFTTSVTKLISKYRYLISFTNSEREFFQTIEENTNMDCLLFQEYSELTSLIHKLHNKSILLPAVIIKLSESENSLEAQQLTHNDFTEYTTKQNSQSIIYHQQRKQFH